MHVIHTVYKFSTNGGIYVKCNFRIGIIINKCIFLGHENSRLWLSGIINEHLPCKVMNINIFKKGEYYDIIIVVIAVNTASALTCKV